MSNAVLEPVAYEDVIETEAASGWHSCAVCKHPRKRHIHGEFECCEVIEVRTVFFTETGETFPSLCQCQFFVERKRPG